MTSGYPYLEPSDAMGLMFQCVLLIPFLFIGYAILNAVGGLVEGRVYTALVQLLILILLVIILAGYGNWKNR